MKRLLSKLFGWPMFLAATLFTASVTVQAQTNAFRYAPSLLPMFTNNPVAINVLTNLMNAPRPALSVPVVSHTNDSPSGTYWTFSSPAPLPFDPFPDLPVYQVSTNDSPDFIIDDRSVDYGAMTNDILTNTFTSDALVIDTNSLYLEVETNSTVSNQFKVLIINTTNGDFYDVLTKTALLLPSWTVENTVTGAVGKITPVTLFQNGRTNLFVWARTATIVISTQPLSQEVLDGDTVTFTAYASGVDLTYQWTLNGTPIYGATGSSYTISAVDYSQGGDYACIITGASGSVTSQTATLTVDSGSGDPNQMEVLGQRQDYTFRSGITYYIGSIIPLYGNTTFEAGTIIKFDYTQLYPSLQVLGSVTCKGVPYNPSILTTIDDDAFGEQWSYGPPQPYVTGVADLDLSQAANLSLTNVWFRYADAAVSTPAGGQLDVWDGQFFQCDASILNEFGGVDSLHNVLFAGCQTAVAADTNSFAVAAENITADVVNLCTASNAPTYVRLTNSIVTGNANGASLQNSVSSPDPSNFQTNGTGNYYLAANSTLHESGTTNISVELLSEFRHKTTYAPVALPEFMSLAGTLTLSPQTPRYTNGAPDKGYYYDALDYTVAGMTNSGSITVEPNTVIGFREDLNTATFWGLTLREESSFVSHGTPDKPITFTDVQWVQEQNENPCFAIFVPNFEGVTNDAAPAMDFRFCNFYPATSWYHVWAGQDVGSDFMASYDSVVNWTMRDCNLHGGQISLGEPDNGDFFGIPYTTFYGVGAVTWNNNLFENVAVNLQPTYDWYDGTINVDLAFQAYNNLFHNSIGIVLAPVPASAGNWTFEDNLFDQVNIFQSTALPLDYDYNGYWPLTALQLQSGYTNQLQATTTSDGFTDGGNEQVLSYAPPYVAGAFGNYYLSTLTGLYESGSRTASAAGLAQYTTFTSQVKDASGSAVNIGLHYVAATNSLPLDTDGDGIPDYVEVENGTDPNNTMSDGMTNDIYNAAYDNVDLSGDGLVGRVKAALGMNPLDSSNPLTLTQIITGQEPQIATFELPINYSTLTNIGEVNLFVDGNYVSWQGSYSGTNGNCRLQWNTIYNPPGARLVQVNLNINGMDIWGSSPDLNTFSAQGAAFYFISTNVMQFDDSYSDFDDSGATLYATTPACPNANYTIELQTPCGQHIKTITNSTSSGIISENWDLTDDNGNVVTNDEVDAIFNVTLLDPAAGKGKQRISKTGGGVSDGNFTIACAFNNGTIARNEMWDCVEYGVVDTLISPPEDGGGGSLNPYNSTFNDYTSFGDIGYPGLLSSSNDVVSLINNLTNSATRNFFMLGHGSATDIGDGASPSQVDLDKNRIADALGNGYSLTSNAMQRKHPYRFAFLFGCHTGDLPEWSDAFGIRQTVTVAQANRGLAQAFVGWRNSPRAPVSDDDWNNFSASLEVFFDEWMFGANLSQCEAAASNPSLAWPFTKQFSAGDKNPNNFKLVTYGYPLIKRNGFSQP